MFNLNYFKKEVKKINEKTVLAFAIESRKRKVATK